MEFRELLALTDPADENHEALLKEEIARFRDVLAKGRSANQLTLFDFLAERSLDARPPKEIEIALELFGTVSSASGHSDSGVRVYVYRLRKRIDDYYAGKAGPRLTIPKGMYRIELEHVLEPGHRPSAFTSLTRSLLANPALSTGLALVFLGILAVITMPIWANLPPQSGVTILNPKTQAGAGAARPDAILAVGDSLFLAETEDQRKVQRLTMIPAIRSREEFGQYMKEHPEVFYRLFDFNLRFASLTSVEAAWEAYDILPTALRKSRVSMMPVSSLNTTQIRGNDIVFVGRLSQLGALEPVVFSRSRFQLSENGRLVDTTSATVFDGLLYESGEASADGDIGYFSVTTGPSGRQLVVLAGQGDRGTAAMAGLLNAPEEIEALNKQAGSNKTFEAVFRVLAPPAGPVERRLVAVYARH